MNSLAVTSLATTNYHVVELVPQTVRQGQGQEVIIIPPLSTSNLLPTPTNTALDKDEIKGEIITITNSVSLVPRRVPRDIKPSIVGQVPIGSLPEAAREILASFQSSLHKALKPVAAALGSVDFGKIDWRNGTSVIGALKPLLNHFQPVITFIKEHPWVLAPLLIPIAFELLLPLVGFAEGGVVLGSIAATLQSWMGNVPKGSLFSFLQRIGDKGLAEKALRMGGMFAVIAVLLTAIFILLLETGVIKPDQATQTIQSSWDSAVKKFQRQVPSGGNQLQIYTPQRSMSLSGGLWTIGWMTAVVVIVGEMMMGH